MTFDGLLEYWQEAVATLSIGGGGAGVFNHKKKIKRLEEEMNEIKTSLKTNTERDIAFKEQFSSHKEELNSRLTRMENQSNTNFQTIISLIKK